ncbi:hypothetical protein LPJ61_004891 [Coemansia biformis]|uniref:Phosphatidylinositol N-acetylglucosaminyltransferase subunit H conserved domain-containing protein n=1 Tax=Coemansia biformis TaxID=1286918 RepID=A0A9W8CUX2_9FUNG|nr:hypothetical protein LPJ61_004891 [Coemansia biformis]
MVLTLALAVLLLAFGDARLGRVPWYSYAVAFAGPLVLLPLQDVCKLHDKKCWVRLQKLAKLDKQPAASPGSTPETEGTAGWSGEHFDERAAPASSEGREPSFLNIDRWPLLGRSSQRRREASDLAAASLPPAGQGLPVPTARHRPSQSFSVSSTAPLPSRDWRLLRDGSSQHKRTSSSSSIMSSRRLGFAGGIFSSSRAKQAAAGHQGPVPFQQHPGSLGASMSPTLRSYSQPSPGPKGTDGGAADSDFIGYPPGGLEIQSDGLLLLCEQKSPDVCEFTVRRDTAGVWLGDMLAIALASWAVHIFFRNHVLLALMPVVLYLARSSLRVCQESLVVIRNVGIQTETVTLAGFRSVRSYELPQIKDLFIHEALQLFEYRYYMALLPRETQSSIVIMFPHLLPKLDALLPVYHGARRLLFPC